MKTTSTFLRAAAGTALVAVLAALASGCTSGSENGSTGENTPLRLTIEGGLSTPESVIHDAQSDVYLVSNINGNPLDENGSGFISRIRPDGTVESLKWIDGGAEGVTLNAPKGMAIAGDTLYVADITVVRKFERGSGKPLGEIAVQGATFLNDLTAASGGTIFVSDTGMRKAGDPLDGAVYSIGPSGEVKAVARGGAIAQPNGLLADGNDVLVLTWNAGTLSRVQRDGKVTQIAKAPAAQLDGIVKDAGGAYLISSWAGSCIYRITPQGESAVAVADLPSPADIGFDARRGLVLVPLFKDNKVLVIAP